MGKIRRQNIVCSAAEDFVHEDIPAEGFIHVIEKSEVGFTKRKMENELLAKQAIVEKRHAERHSKKRKMKLRDILFISDFLNERVGMPVEGVHSNF